MNPYVNKMLNSTTFGEAREQREFEALAGASNYIKVDLNYMTSLNAIEVRLMDELNVQLI